MKNEYLKNLNKIEFVVTYACTGRCKHCSEGDHDLCGERISPENAAESVRKIAAEYGIKTVMTFGGEPLLYADAVYAIMAAAKEYLPKKLQGYKTFRADAKRADKRFPLKSPEIAAQIGGAVLSSVPGIKVSLNEPEINVMVEIREEYAYIHAGAYKGAGGMPVGTAGRALLLLSGGIDSPVAGYMMAKRGARVEAVHFESFPYTSEAAREKVLELARIISDYCGPVKVHVVSVTEIQERLRDTVDEEYFTLLLRRSMMRLASQVAKLRECNALITGESLGQVASQTMLAMGVTDPAAGMLIFRPCIGMDKDEIITIARKINTFDTSILPYEDCCTVFTPRHPKTRPELPKVLLQEEKADLAELENAAFASLTTYYMGG